jgi:hypothetical protein
MPKLVAIWLMDLILRKNSLRKVVSRIIKINSITEITTDEIGFSINTKIAKFRARFYVASILLLR